MEQGFHLAGFLPFLLFAIPFAIGNYFLAERMGRNKILWVILTLIPIVNLFFLYYVIYAVILYILDKLNAPARGPEAGA